MSFWGLRSLISLGRALELELKDEVWNLLNYNHEKVDY